MSYITLEDITPQSILGVIEDPQTNIPRALKISRVCKDQDVLDTLELVSEYIAKHNPSCYRLGFCFCQMTNMFAAGVATGIALANRKADQESLETLIK